MNNPGTVPQPPMHGLVDGWMCVRDGTDGHRALFRAGDGDGQEERDPHPQTAAIHEVATGEGGSRAQLQCCGLRGCCAANSGVGLGPAGAVLIGQRDSPVLLAVRMCSLASKQ